MCEGCEDFASGLCWGCSEKLTWNSFNVILISKYRTMEKI
jgi:hypothetical protein